MSRALVAIVVPILGALLLSCSGSGRTLSFSQMQSLNPGVSGEWVLQEYPFAGRVSRWPDGHVKALRYAVTDPLGKRRGVDLDFDNQGILANKRYNGPIVRPPKDPENGAPPKTPCSPR